MHHSNNENLRTLFFSWLRPLIVLIWILPRQPILKLAIYIYRGPTGSHLITTVNCHSSFRFPPQHTLRARGVCSRIPHPRQISRDSHGQLSTHVYILHIIPFLGCPPHSPPTTAANTTRTIQPPIFFPFTIKTFYRSNFLFTIIPQPFFPAHTSHIPPHRP